MYGLPYSCLSLALLSSHRSFSLSLSSLPLSSLVCPSLVFPSLVFPSLVCHSVVFISLVLPFPFIISFVFPSLVFPSRIFRSQVVHTPGLLSVWSFIVFPVFVKSLLVIACFPIFTFLAALAIVTEAAQVVPGRYVHLHGLHEPWAQLQAWWCTSSRHHRTGWSGRDGLAGD